MKILSRIINNTIYKKKLVSNKIIYYIVITKRLVLFSKYSNMTINITPYTKERIRTQQKIIAWQSMSNAINEILQYADEKEKVRWIKNLALQVLAVAFANAIGMSTILVHVALKKYSNLYNKQFSTSEMIFGILSIMERIDHKKTDQTKPFEMLWKMWNKAHEKNNVKLVIPTNPKELIPILRAPYEKMLNVTLFFETLFPQYIKDWRISEKFYPLIDILLSGWWKPESTVKTIRAHLEYFDPKRTWIPITTEEKMIETIHSLDSAELNIRVALYNEFTRPQVTKTNPQRNEDTIRFFFLQKITDWYKKANNDKWKIIEIEAKDFWSTYSWNMTAA